MRIVAAVAAVVTGALGGAGSAHAAAGTIAPVGDPIAGQYVVTLNVPRTEVGGTARALAGAVGGRVGFVYTHALTGFSISGITRADALALSRRAGVSLVQEDGRLHAIGTQANPPYGLDRIDQRALPLNQSYTYGNDGAGVHAYDLDTGINASHVEFEGRASIGTDTVGDGRNGVDCNGHGTHTAGTIGSEAYGVAKGVALVAVRVLDCNGSGSSSGIVAGIDWVTGHAIKPAVANMSLGTSTGRDTTIENAVTNSINSGVVYAVAAGNGLGNGLGIAQDACNFSPSATPAALTVSATDSTDTKPSWANTGTCVDIFAPGVNTLSTWYTSTTATQTESGTSMATPHVTGAAALYLAANPSATPAQVASALTSNATAGVVKSPGSGSPNKLLYVGFIGGGGGTNAAPTASFTSSCTGATCTFTDASTDSDGTIASRAWDFGDGQASTATNPSHTYAASGTYTVRLTVTDNGGATGTTTRTVTVSTGGGGDPDPATPTLTSGVSTSGTSAAAGGWKYYKIQVPAGKSSLRLDVAGPSCGLLSCPADLDLFGRRAAKPTTTVHDCSAETGSSTETCTITAPAADWYYVGVYTYSGSANQSFTVKATIT